MEVTENIITFIQKREEKKNGPHFGSYKYLPKVLKFYGPCSGEGSPMSPPYQITMAAYDNGDYVFGERLMRSLFRSRENSIFYLVSTYLHN